MRRKARKRNRPENQYRTREAEDTRATWNKRAGGRANIGAGHDPGFAPSVSERTPPVLAQQRPEVGILRANQKAGRSAAADFVCRYLALLVGNISKIQLGRAVVSFTTARRKY